MQPAAIGVFDSGVGGLSVWREMAAQLPHVDLIYLADQAYCPYGVRSMGEIRALARGITAFLIAQGAEVVVVACNTASAAALHDLRRQFSLPIVGMEPAIKPAVAHTQTGHVGVIATSVTFQGALFASLLERFAHGVTVHTQVCPGLVEQVETGALQDDRTRGLLRQYLRPLLEAEVDTLVLGCTHYPFLRAAIEQVAGPSVAVIDPASAVARQAGRMLEQVRPDAPSGRQGRHTFYTTGDLPSFRQAVIRLVDGRGEIRAVRWGYDLARAGSAA